MQQVSFYQKYSHSGATCVCVLCSGYGMSDGRPSERRMYADVDCAWNALRTRLGVPSDEIVLYGQSIGTVPTVDLATHIECAGVVLHSPLTSGIRVACRGTRKTWCCDSFPRFSHALSPNSVFEVLFGTPCLPTAPPPTCPPHLPWRNSRAHIMLHLFTRLPLFTCCSSFYSPY